MHYVFEQGVNTTKTRCMYEDSYIFSQTLDVVSSYRILGNPLPPKTHLFPAPPDTPPWPVSPPV